MSTDSYAAYRKAPVKRLAVTNVDDDTRGVSVTKTGENTSEAGGQSTFTVKLLSRPLFRNNASAFSIPVSSSDPTEGTVSVSSLRFTFDNWDIPQTVTVTGVDDTEADGNVNYSIILGQIVADNNESVDYAGIDPEDVALSNLDNDSPTLDFGDAPNKTQSGFASDYPTSLSQNGARHLVTGLRLGANLDAEFDGAPNSQAGLTSGGDDGSGIADEDGVKIVASLVASLNSVTTASLSVNASAAAKLDGWIDFNQDGDWADASEQIFSSLTVASGLNLLNFAIPAGAKSGNTFARFRLSSSGGQAPTGAASDGEVEDYMLPILSSQIGAEASLSLPFASSIDVVADSLDLVVRNSGIELFRAPLAGLTLRLQGSAGDDVFNLSPIPAVAFGTILQFDGGLGTDAIRIVNSGSTLDFSGANQTHIKSIESIDVTGTGANRLQLDLSAVNQASTRNGTLRIRHDENDIFALDSNWKVSEPSFAGSTFVHVLSQGLTKVMVENTRPYKNPLVSTDVDRDDSTSPLDVLQVVNALNSNMPRSLNAPTSSSQLPNFAYLDADGDGSLSPLDALVLINHINSKGSGEGEKSSRTGVSRGLFWSPLGLDENSKKKRAWSTGMDYELRDQYFQNYE
ncbi:MAG: GEVED domain-containing protein [Planctomycetota bacterium]|nr:GEVED domain-containing protein [Planctomycetota bacterium]